MLNRQALLLAMTVDDLPQVKQAVLDMACRGHQAPTMETSSTYYDTPASRLRRDGLTLSIRRQGHEFLQSVEEHCSSGTDPFAQRRWEDIVEADQPDTRAPNSGAHLPEALAEAELRARFTRVVRHTLFTLEPDTATRIEGALNEGELHASEGGRSQPISEVELELKGGSVAALYEIAQRLLAVAPLRIEIRSKVQRGHDFLNGAAAEPQFRDPFPLELKPAMTVEETLQRIGTGCLASLLRNERAAVAGVPDGVHQMRVAVRRLRSAVNAVKRMLPQEQYEWVRRELKWLADALGPARNWDVFATSLVAPVRSALLGERDLDSLHRVCEIQRHSAHETASAAILSTQYTALMLKLAQWFASCRWRDQPVTENSALLMAPIGDIAPTLIARRYRKVKKVATDFDELTLQHRHEVRIAVKKLRYTTEFLKDLFEQDKVAEFVRHLKPLQDELGHANDVRVASELMASLRNSVDPAGLARAAGIVLGWHDRGLADHDRKLHKRVRRLRHARPFW